MLRQAQKHWRRSGGMESRAAFVRGVLPGLKSPAGSFDLIVTHCFLDCFTEDKLSMVIEEIASLATPSASWLLADFAVPASGPARWRAQAILRLAYALFRWSAGINARSVDSPVPWLKRAGFIMAGYSESEWGLLYSEFWTRAEVPAEIQNENEIDAPKRPSDTPCFDLTAPP